MLVALIMLASAVHRPVEGKVVQGGDNITWACKLHEVVLYTFSCLQRSHVMRRLAETMVYGATLRCLE